MRILGVDIGGTKIACAIATVEHDALNASHRMEMGSISECKTNASQGGKEVLACVIRAIASKLAENADEPVDAIGIGSAGSIDPADGVIAYANDLMPGWMGIPLKAEVQSTFRIPTFAINDVQAHAIGEKVSGCLFGCSDAMMVALGTGCGGAVICNGTIVTGNSGFAGHIGSTLVRALGYELLSAQSSPDDVVSMMLEKHCSNAIEIEAVSSGSGIESQYLKLTGFSKSGKEISRMSQEGDLASSMIVAQAGYALGMAIRTWADILNPSVIAIGGSASYPSQVWEEAFATSLERCFDNPLQMPIVKRSKLGGSAPLIGAAEYAYMQLSQGREM